MRVYASPKGQLLWCHSLIISSLDMAWVKSMSSDNCVGQNKNNTVLQYLLWRVVHGLHETISLNFLIVGHIKFAPDWAFGLVKQSYRRKMVSCLEEIVDVVQSSTLTGVNIPQLVGREDGEVIVKQRNWQSFLEAILPTPPGNNPTPALSVCNLWYFCK